MKSFEPSELVTSRTFWLAGFFPLLFLSVVYGPSIGYLVHLWIEDENFSHGFFVPVITIYLIWQKRHALAATAFQGSWWGVAVLIAGFVLFILGELTTLYVLLHLSLLIVLIGLLLSAIGWRGLREIAFPIAFLFTMIPLPGFLIQNLSAKLQLISSEFAVAFDQMIGLTAFREGNVIDFGPIQLQVAEACSGLRYLFPLATLALMISYLFQDKFWKKIILFLSSIPIAIFLNGFRIGMTGLLVDRFGEGMAEGFFHGFSGWLLFVTALSLLFLEVALLGGVFSRRKKRTFYRLFSPPERSGEAVPPISDPAALRKTGLSKPYFVSLALLLPLVLVSVLIVSREEIVPGRKAFFDFPMSVEDWRGRQERMEPEYIKVLKFDDYILADYRSDKGTPVNFYSAWYNSQKKGQSAHSPRTCIPGGGWEITSLRELQLEEHTGRQPLKVNRVMIQKGDQKEVVYYWFQERGRNLTDEYQVKLFLFWDALTKNRTDGALVRLVSAVLPGESEMDTDHRIQSFARSLYPRLANYIPD